MMDTRNIPTMNLTPDILRTFVAAAQSGNFTHAAKKVHLTQSAVSMQISRLESDIGKPLFNRITRGVELTSHGERLLRYALRLLQIHDKAVASLTGPNLNGQIRLGVPEELSFRYLPGILRSFSARYPLISVDIYCDFSNRLKEMVEEGKLDLCLANDETGSRIGHFLRNEPVVWIAPRDAAPEMESPLPLALFHQGCMYRKWGMQALAQKAIPFRIAYSSPSFAGILAAVRSGVAVAPVGKSSVTQEFRILETLPALPYVCITLYSGNGPEDKAKACLFQHIAGSFDIPAEPRI